MIPEYQGYGSPYHRSKGAGFQPHFLASRKMRLLLIAIISLFCLLGVTDSHVLGQTANYKRILSISGDRKVYILAPWMDVLEDKQGGLNIHDIKEGRFAEAFKAISSNALNLGLSSSVFWFRFRLVLAPEFGKNAKQIRIFDPCIAFPGRVAWELFDGNSGRRLASGGSRNNRDFFAAVSMESTPRNYYLRIRSTTGLLLNPSLYIHMAFLEHTRTTMAWFGVFYGIVFAVAAYNFFLFFSFNDKSYLWYVLHLVFVILYFLCINGLAGSYLLSDQPELLGRLSRSFLALVSAFMALLTRSFFLSDVRTPKIDKVILALFSAACALAVLNFVVPARMINAFLILIGIAVPFVMSIAAFAALMGGFRPARLFLAAYGLFFIGVLLFAMTTGGLIPFTPVSFYGFQTGTAVTAILLSFALGDRIRTLRLEKASLEKSMERVTAIMDSVECGIFLIETESRTIMEINQSVIRIIGGNREKIVGQPCWKFIPSARDTGIEAHEMFMGKDHHEDSLMSVSGKKVPVLRRAKRIQLEDHDLILASFADISELKRAEAALRRSEDKFRSLFESSRDAIMLIENDRFVDCNSAALEMFRCENAAQFLGRSPDDFSPLRQPSGSESRSAVQKGIMKSVKQGSHFFEWTHRRMDGELFPAEVMLSVVETGEKQLIQALVRDITHRKKMENDLKRLAETDPLTGADNRRSFFRKGEHELLRSRRYKRPLSLLMLDVDHFKSVNDTYGHQAGDEVLRMLVEKCHQVLRATDLFGRMGGEEFAVILPETDDETAMVIAERLRRELSKCHVKSDDGAIRFTVSIGMATLESDDQVLERVINRADSALYHAKEAGRDRVVKG